MPKLILIRHAQTRQQPDVSAHRWQLTEKGRTDCVRLADALKPYGIQRMVTSEEPKARLTGELTADVLGIPCEAAPDLHETKRETVSYFEDLADFQAAIRAAMESPDDLLFGEETFVQARNRFTQAVERLSAAHPHETLAIVTHGTVLSLYASQFVDQSAYDIWQALDMPAYFVLNLPDKTIDQFVSTLI